MNTLHEPHVLYNPLFGRAAHHNTPKSRAGAARDPGAGPICYNTPTFLDIFAPAVKNVALYTECDIPFM